MKKLYASDGISETAEPGALMFPQEELICIPEADSEAVPMPPLRRLRSCFFDDGPHSEIREGDLANMRRKYAIHPSVGMRSPTDFKRAPDGGAGEVVVYEAYLEAGFRGVIPSLIGEVSSFFGFCPSQLTPLTWRTLMAIQILGKLHGFSFGVHEILYSYYFAPLMNKPNRYMFVKIQEPVGYPTSWRTVDKCVPPGFLCWRSSSEAYNGSSSTIPMGELSDVSRPVSFAGEAVAKLIMGVPRRFRWVNFLLFPRNVARLPVSVVYDEYQKAKARKQRPSYTPPPRLARAALSANGPSSTSSTSVEVGHDRDPLVDAHRRLIGEVFLLRGQLQDIVARRDLLVQQVKASARWELMKEWLEKRVEHSNPEEAYQRHYFLSRGDVLPPVLRSKWNYVVYDASLFIGYVRTQGSSGDPEVVEEPGDPEIVSGPRGLYLDPEVAWEPGEDVLPPVLRSKWNVVVYDASLFVGYVRTRGSSGDPEVSRSPEVIFESCDCIRDPEVSLDHPEIVSGPRGLYLDPEVAWEPGGTILRLPRQGYYRYLFGFRILPLGSWPLSRSYVVFYFCRKSLTSFRGCWCGCYDPSASCNDLDAPFIFGTLRPHRNPKGPYSAFLGKATSGTYLDFAFCRSEAGRYRDPMLYSTSAGSH
ncbi:hypothetical protein F2Q69_00042161 [Brassica cretica]|uniref:Uncharacterized protein n=1 Tax=Brassica cretica TaxID=69181 RepID=A0A8S9NG78_BRACR|nr:hypothetical protein F2Q69_00042161 [Brassica cretica]